jgi:hypothetical protein
MPVSPHYIQLALYTDYMAIIATPHKPVLLISHLESHLSNIEWWLREWRIAINVLKSTMMLFASSDRRSPKHRPVQLFREPIHLVDTACYVHMTLDT